MALILDSAALSALSRPRSALRRGYTRVTTTGARVSGIAGHTLAGVGAGSEPAVDAVVVATAVRPGGGLVLTHDPSDLERRAPERPNVRVAAI